MGMFVLQEDSSIVIDCMLDHHAAWRYYGALYFTDFLGEESKLETHADLFFDIGNQDV